MKYLLLIASLILVLMIVTGCANTIAKLNGRRQVCPTIKVFNVTGIPWEQPEDKIKLDKIAKGKGCLNRSKRKSNDYAVNVCTWFVEKYRCKAKIAEFCWHIHCGPMINEYSKRINY